MIDCPDTRRAVVVFTRISAHQRGELASLFTAGVGLWLIYGLIIEKWPLILANALTFALALSILLLKLRTKGQG
ncbi:MAG: hypothetical protein B7Y05_06265 [Polynucleobacter sp. 24-46-87]|nr:MAG: hypothetical protein B7Y05_06265 [Polynucleobacter sp. 24-46-87]